MMYMMPFKDLLIMHFLLGASVCIWAAIRAKRRDNKPPRSLFQFGSGLFGETNKWIQWFSWSITFDLLTSILYIHTGLFYYEIAMSAFEAIATTVGAFVIDRFFDLFVGAADLTLPKPKIDLSGIKAKKDELTQSVKDNLRDLKEQVKSHEPVVDEAAIKATAEAKAREDHQKFDDLIKGH